MPVPDTRMPDGCTTRLAVPEEGVSGTPGARRGQERPTLPVQRLPAWEPRAAGQVRNHGCGHFCSVLSHPTGPVQAVAALRTHVQWRAC
jgi:hypothetical protein